VSHILLTGGSGFFGRALLRTWLAQFNSGLAIPKVTILTRSQNAFLCQFPEFDQLEWLNFCVGDICKPATLPKDVCFTHILHAAADSTLGPQLALLQRYDQIVNGTRHMLDLAISCGAKRFLLTSSGAVYGVQPSHLKLIPESWHGSPDTLDAANAHGVAKRAAEHLCALYSSTYGLETVIARCFSFVGQDLPMNVHFAIGNFIRDALWHHEITVAGDGTPLRSYLDQRDLANWLLRLLEHGKSRHAYNVGSDYAISMADLARLVRDIVARDKSICILGQPSFDSHRHMYVPNIEKARSNLGLDVSIDLVEAIRTTAMMVSECS